MDSSPAGFDRSEFDRSGLRRRYLALDSALVADVLDELGLVHQGLDTRFGALAGTKLVGWAYTIAGGPNTSQSGGDPNKMVACSGIGPDEVSVWATESRVGVAYFGELIARGMAEKGSVGALVEGSARDVTWLEQLGFAVFGTFASPVQSIGRWAVKQWQRPVELPGATSDRVLVRPGDLIVADADGVVVVPIEVVVAVAERAEELAATEVLIREALSGGASLSEVLERFGHV